MRPLALVTGASSGIGFEIAAQLSARGYDIVGVGASGRIGTLQSELEKAADAATPVGTVVSVRADLSTAEGVEHVWDQVESLGRHLDVAVLNAGKSLGGSFVDTDLEDELRMLDLNVTGQVRLAKHVVQTMARQRSGRILITASLSALTPTPYESIYGPTRAFTYAFAQGLREEMKEYGVVVTALLPGATATGFHHTAGMDNTVFGSNEWKNDPSQVARQGVEALFADRDHVVGGNLATRRAALLNRVLPERVKARRFAKDSRPTPLHGTH
ncbi:MULTISPECIES: SDR family NAD(P)-dependent oxidoreductase [Kocuria]|uniref:SDR family NAD(P)-dependent oxidoreductase n=1 Tax=Kocuria TaxID=57493 RepID=UPI0011A5C373|nr:MULTISPECIES: SDR family NAD(P)-dependent oxidoreductase [Kocuria]MBS6029147.1 SDR family NAD(P)-dependent oxidoreductase [Kocuria rhizophila]